MNIGSAKAMGSVPPARCIDKTSVERGRKWVNAYFWGLLAIVFIVIIYTFDDYGVTWDEWVHSRYGELVIDYFKSGFHDKRANSFFNLRYYGPLFDSGTALIYNYFGTPKFETRHLCTALMALLTLAGVFLYARQFANPYVTVFSSLALITLPRFYGHSFSNSKDIPFACLFVWSMVGISRACVKKTLSWRWVVFCGVTIGLALSIRTGGFLLFYFLIAGRVYTQLCNRPLPCRRTS